MTQKEKEDISRRFKSGDMSTREYWDFKRKTGYGVCRFCGKVVKFRTVMRYKRMVKHKCPHGTWCRTGTHTGNNVPHPRIDCIECCKESTVTRENRKIQGGLICNYC